MKRRTNPVSFETSQISLLGDRRENQDRCAVLCLADIVLLVVADGMGGHPKGDEAAQVVVETCQDIFMRVKKPISDPAQFLDYLSHQAHQRIVEHGEQQTPPVDPRTTLVMAVVQDGKAWWGHIGDSRLYYLSGNRLIERTIDHSYVEKLLQDGLIEPHEVDRHPFKNYVTRCLGGLAGSPLLALSEQPVALQQGDVLMLCSDGLWGQMDDDRIITAFDAVDMPLDTLLKNAANMAEYEASPGSDNVTAVALRWLRPSAKPATDAAAQHQPADDDEVSQAVSSLRDAIDNFEQTRRSPPRKSIQK
jgi:serine/threonine protein phosphatase PrpC